MSEAAQNNNNEQPAAGQQSVSGEQPASGQQQQQQPASGQQQPRYTQAEVDALVTARLKEEAKKTSKAERDKQLSEMDKLKADLDAANARIQQAEARDAFHEAATAAKAANPNKLFRLVGSELLFGEDGKPANLASLMAQAQKDFPEEFGKAESAAGAKVNAGSVDGGAGQQQAATLTKDQIGKMSAEQINANWSAVSKALAGG